VDIRINELRQLPNGKKEAFISSLEEIKRELKAIAEKNFKEDEARDINKVNEMLGKLN